MLITIYQRLVLTRFKVEFYTETEIKNGKKTQFYHSLMTFSILIMEFSTKITIYK